MHASGFNAIKGMVVPPRIFCRIEIKMVMLSCTIHHQDLYIAPHSTDITDCSPLPLANLTKVPDPLLGMLMMVPDFPI